MAETMQARCPNCRAVLKVPVSVAGKKIRCKNCETVFTVAGGSAPTPGKAAPIAVKPVKPATDTLKLADEPPRPGAAKPVAPAPGEKVKRPYDEEEDDGPKEYGVQKDDLDIPRCPFCAKELDPPDTKICMNCGFDLLGRRRHESKKVYGHTTGDYVLYHLPTAGCILAIGLLIFIDIYCWSNMSDWFEGSFLEMDDTDPQTQKKKYYAPPGFCTLWIIVPSLYAIWKAGVFTVRRFINWKPPEVIKKA